MGTWERWGTYRGFRGRHWPGGQFFVFGEEVFRGGLGSWSPTTFRVSVVSGGQSGPLADPFF